MGMFSGLFGNQTDGNRNCARVAASVVELHEICCAFSEMTPSQYKALRDDIAEFGVREPVWDFQGKLIDGLS